MNANEACSAIDRWHNRKETSVEEYELCLKIVSTSDTTRQFLTITLYPVQSLEG